MTKKAVIPMGEGGAAETAPGRTAPGLLAHRAPRAHPVVYPPVALLVPRLAGDEAPVRRALEDEGWFVRTCAGPGNGRCPLLRAARCPLRESVDVAVVFVDPTEAPRALRTMPRVRCAADTSSPGVLALENRLGPPQYSGGTATVGSLRGPGGVLSAISALLGARAGD